MATKKSQIDPARAKAAVQIARSQFPDAKPTDDVANDLGTPWERTQMAVLFNKACPNFLRDHFAGLAWVSIESGELRTGETFQGFAALMYLHLLEVPKLTAAIAMSGIPELNVLALGDES